MKPLTDAPGLPTVFDLHLVGQGKHERLWDVLGAHVHDDGASAARRTSVTRGRLARGAGRSP